MSALLKPAVMAQQDFEFFRARIFSLAGISLSEAKLDLLQSRLRPRLLATGLSNFREYRKFLEEIENDHDEWEIFTNLLTTNKTDWFREIEHFTYLTEEFLPRWKKLGKKHLTVWCAASSTGEEPYTLSLVLEQALHGTGITFEIQASDIDTKVLNQARNGVYDVMRLSQVPDKYKNGFLVGTGDISNWMKVKKKIKAPVTFSQVNLTKIPYRWKQPYDLVMCRNVLIYFNQDTIRQVVEGFYQVGCPDSVLIIAHSESLQNIKTSWKYIKPSIYSKGKIF
ncbi:MAG: protein-glutamate O-methyltransferase CheR [Bdellovibrionota bacterium]